MARTAAAIWSPAPAAGAGLVPGVPGRSCRVSRSTFTDQGLGSGGSGFGIQDLEFGGCGVVWDLGFGVLGLGFGVRGPLV